ncbi:Predicted enzyme of the cupin superfamily [Paraburkholderia phenazinium]|uniref:Predicted enzyme of the cupin superfamily n=1 Tax=Paraburkholderia phenazinium TaxID=60549 RepID=A0A1G7U3M7_9BURK|nr:cupin domain-containing protein [Paraburkholderia phenazinium]SDG42245.1 Predicted enzyme of the cupin superfamily [Paraburkholderia phenazinium]
MSKSQQAVAEHRSSKSFVDLRKFASDKSAGIPSTGSAIENRYLSSRRLLDWQPGPVSAGVIALDAGCGVVPPQPVDEFIIVAEGEIALSHAEREFTLGPGDSAVLVNGVEFSWSARGPVSIIFMRYHGSQSADGKIVPIQHAPQLEPSGTPPAELLLTPAPACRNFTDYRSADGEFVCGTWDSTPYHRSAMFFRHCELMYLLEGSVTFVDESGRAGTFERGDIFLIEQGAQCSWKSREHVAKVYAIYRPA